jgi:hypothetical protein
MRRRADGGRPPRADALAMSAISENRHQLERRLEDVRLLYGLGVPFFVCTLIIIAALLIGTIWAAAFALAAIVVMAVIAVIGVTDVLSDEDGSED